LSATEISFAFPEIKKNPNKYKAKWGEHKEKCRPFPGNYETK